MLENLTSKFSRVLSAFGIKKRLTEGNIEESLAEIRAALIEADVALPVIKNFVQRVKERVLGQEVLASVNPGDFFVKILHDELVSFLGGEANHALQLGEANQTNAILLCGLQGAGKTTTCGKLALKLKTTRDIVLVSLDVNRPAAAEQLRILAGQAGVDYYDRGTETDVKKIVKGAFDHAKKAVRNLVIFDTAGRTQIDEAMLAELKTVHNLVRPVETLLVVDAMIGQQALAVASEFKNTVPVSSLIFTKFDSDTRGGAVLSVKDTIGVPIAFVGVGEAIQGLETFDASRI
ncbi:MAG: signal recognition particle protein, partial [Spirochaetia bacterium]|nr:signal recognition particle protein [Spirochaetia bacterium]